MLQTLLSSAERFACRYTRRQFDPTPALVDGVDSAPAVTKNFVVRRGRVLVRVPDLRSITTITLDGMALDTYNGYVPIEAEEEPVTSIQFYQPFGSTSSTMYGTGALSITGRWGWNPVPDDVKTAVMALTMRMYKERKAQWGDTILLPDGSVIQYFRQLPASVQAGLGTYRKVNLAIV